MDFYEEPARKLAAREYDVVVAGGGTGGVIAAIASARVGAKTALVEVKGYTGGTAVEGGTALHSFYNLWKAFPGVQKRQVVKGIAQELIDRLAEYGGTSGHAEMLTGFDYDSVCTAIDTEIYKYVTLEMLVEAGVDLLLNTFLVDAVVDDSRVRAAIVESRSGREALFAKSFVDCTGYGDLCGHASARFSEPNDYPVANSTGVGGIDVEKYRDAFSKVGALTEYSQGHRSGRDGKAVRVNGRFNAISPELAKEAAKIGMAAVTTTVHDDYLMFIKFNVRMSVSPTHRDEAAFAELELRRRQMRGIELLRKYMPGCERAYITRTSPSICIRRGRLVECDYDISLADVLDGRHFDDDVMAYGFHDSAPRLQVANGGTYGIPYRALRVAGVENLLAAGMLITSDHDAHMSTRNTVCCMGQGQAAGTAAALCATKGVGTRELPYVELREALEKGGVYFES